MHLCKKPVRIALTLVCALFPLKTWASSDVANPLFGYTHLLPSPFTLPAGTLTLGTDISLGVTDFFQIGTNILRDAYSIFNVHGKLAIIDREEFAMGAFLGWETYNLQNIDSRNPDRRITSWLPGLTTGFAPLEQVAVFFGGNLNITDSRVTDTGIQTSGYVNGARLNSDISWAYNPRKKGVGNVLSGGVSFDINYDLFGIGASHHWGGFQLGVHYYPAASKYKLQPILAGGATVEL